MTEEYRRTDKFIREEMFMATMRGLSAPIRLGDSQIVLNSSHNTTAVEHRIGDLQEQEKLLTSLSSPLF